ncbi:hypothetical protein [Streptomyces sp. NPDC005077]|uniref:hypothetical protein n=1 Tax=Streptomyces sp. NPDC005077 TaxID=3154292 RepID=UPI0033BE1996
MKLFARRRPPAPAEPAYVPSRSPLLMLCDLPDLPGTVGHVFVQSLSAFPGPTVGGDPVELARTPDGQLWASGRARVYVAPASTGVWAKVTSAEGNLSLELPPEAAHLIALFAIDPDTGDGDRRSRRGWFRVAEQPTRKVLD